jgi:hypothetical protein
MAGCCAIADTGQAILVDHEELLKWRRRIGNRENGCFPQSAAFVRDITPGARSADVRREGDSGHSQISTTMRYTHPTPDTMRDATAEMDVLFPEEDDDRKEDERPD